MKSKSGLSVFLLLVFWIAMYSAFVNDSQFAKDVVVIMAIPSAVIALMLMSLSHEQKMKVGKHVKSYRSDIFPDVFFNNAAGFVFLTNGYIFCAVAVLLKSYMLNKIFMEVLQTKIATGEVKPYNKDENL